MHNLYEELDKFRSIVSEADHTVCGFNMYRRGEDMRHAAMRSLSEDHDPLVEETRYADDDAIFFFRKVEAARAFYEHALSIGLSEGEVVLDPTIDRKWGVGQYGVRLMPHVRESKPEVMLALYRKASGRCMSMAQYGEWMEVTGGSLCCDVLDEMQGGAYAQPSHSAYGQATHNMDAIPNSTDSGKDHVYGRLPGGNTDVHAMTQKQSGRMGASVHDLTQNTVGRLNSPAAEEKGKNNRAFTKFQSAETGGGNPNVDLVNDGTNGTPMDGGRGGVPSNYIRPGSVTATARFGIADDNEQRADHMLSEELSQLGIDCGLEGIRQLCD